MSANTESATPTAKEFLRVAESGGVARALVKPSARHERVPNDDGLENILGSQTIFSITEFAKLINRSGATVWRLLRLGHLEAVEVGGIQGITRAEVLRFLRYGNRKAA
jgi:hypothetical protein